MVINHVVCDPSEKVTVTGEVVQRGAQPMVTTNTNPAKIPPMDMIITLIIGIMAGIGITLYELRWRR